MQIETESIREEVAFLPSGDKKIQLSTKRPLYNKGRVIGIVGNTIDITELKKTQEVFKEDKKRIKTANQKLVEAMANISHDLRTPLSSVMLVANALKSDVHHDKIKTYGNLLHTISQKLFCLVDDITDSLSIEQMGEDSVSIESFDLHANIESLRQTLLPLTQTKDIQFQIQIDPTVPHYISSDRLKLERILLNLIGNAIKFTEKGYVKLEIRKITNKQLELCVSDTGIGISKDKLPYLFDRFFRGNLSSAGNGLGLYIVKKFVTLLSGRIDVQSEVGKGASFVFSLPITS